MDEIGNEKKVAYPAEFEPAACRGWMVALMVVDFVKLNCVLTFTKVETT